MNLKQQVGIEAAKLVKSGMTVGLGTGSTVYYLVEELGRLAQEEGLDFVATSTSTRTRQQGEKLGLTVVDIDDAPPIDLTIDGADEVDPHFNGIKGEEQLIYSRRLSLLIRSGMYGLWMSPSWSNS